MREKAVILKTIIFSATLRRSYEYIVFTIGKLRFTKIHYKRKETCTECYKDWILCRNFSIIIRVRALQSPTLNGPLFSWKNIQMMSLSPLSRFLKMRQQLLEMRLSFMSNFSVWGSDMSDNYDFKGSFSIVSSSMIRGKETPFSVPDNEKTRWKWPHYCQ